MVTTEETIEEKEEKKCPVFKNPEFQVSIGAFCPVNRIGLKSYSDRNLPCPTKNDICYRISNVLQTKKIWDSKDCASY